MRSFGLKRRIGALEHGGGVMGWLSEERLRLKGASAQARDVNSALPTQRLKKGKLTG